MLDKSDLTRINNCVNGNPRYVFHFMRALTDREIVESESDVGNKYLIAVNRCKKLFSCRKFHNKQYGGGIVFSSYNTDDEIEILNNQLVKDNKQWKTVNKKLESIMENSVMPN